MSPWLPPIVRPVLVSFGLWVSWPMTASSQSPDSERVAFHARCAALTTPDVQHLFRLARFPSACPQTDSILVRLWQQRPVVQPEQLQQISYYHPSHTLLVQVTRVARDQTQPDTVRLAALQVMLNCADPYFIELEVRPDTTPGHPRGTGSIMSGAIDHPYAGPWQWLQDVQEGVKVDLQAIAQAEPATRVGRTAAVMVGMVPAHAPRVPSGLMLMYNRPVEDSGASHSPDHNHPPDRPASKTIPPSR